MKFLLVAIGLTLLLGCSSAQAANIEEVTSHGGIRAWLVEDRNLPLISMQFAFQGGVEEDPPAKQGLANLAMDLLTEGAGPFDAEAFQRALADHSIDLTFSAGRDALMGSVKTLSADQKTAFDLLHDALTKPHFDVKEMERVRAQQLASLRVQLGNPDWQARYALFQTIFRTHPYGERRLGTTQTLAHITRDDIKNFIAAHCAQDNLVVAVAGDMTPQELAKLLDEVFGDLPKHAHRTPIAEVQWPQETAALLIPREGTQTELLFAMPGPKRDDPEWYAAEIANYILGGGGFSSRLMQEVRDKNGLTYGITTSLSPMKYGGLFVGEAATDNAKTGKAWDITLETMRHFFQEGATEKEVEAAKDYLTGALPLAMTSTDKITDVLVEVQLNHLGLDYLDRRNDLIRRVTMDEIDHVIQHWFDPDRLTLTMVGKPEGMNSTKIQEQVRD